MAQPEHTRGPTARQRTWRLMRCGALVFSVVASVALSGAAETMSTDDGTMWVGVTHGQYSADSWSKPAAVARARAILQASFPLQNQHIMGWGAMNPEPSNGVYDFGSLDARVKLMRATGDTMVLTLCCSPDWMKGGAAGSTDWSALEKAPLAAHFDDFAKLAATVARRYPDVKRFLVWNELKGFFDPVRNTWDIEAYTILYNKVYDALKAVDASIQIGGPYVPMDSWTSPPAANRSSVAGPWGVVDQRSLDAITYWLAHAHGADFIAVDGGTGTRDQPDAQPSIAQNGKFSAINAWLRGVTSLPIWWAEMHLGQAEDQPDAASADMLESALATQAASGAAVVLLWQPEGTLTGCRLCMWTSTREATGGMASAPYLAVAPALSAQPVAATDFGVAPVIDSPVDSAPTSTMATTVSPSGGSGGASQPTGLSSVDGAIDALIVPTGPTGVVSEAPSIATAVRLCLQVGEAVGGSLELEQLCVSSS